MKELIINFGGFYHSWHDRMIEGVIEREIENLETEYNINIEKLPDMFDLDFKAIYIQYAKELVEALNAESDLISVNFLELSSPKFYNYSTDKIIATINPENYYKVVACTLFNDGYSQELQQTIADTFTSCSGFYSFYSNDLKEWQKQEDLDDVQLGFLYDFLMQVIIESDLYNEPYNNNSFNDTINNLVTDTIYTTYPELNDLWSD